MDTRQLPERNETQRPLLKSQEILKKTFPPSIYLSDALSCIEQAATEESDIGHGLRAQTFLTLGRHALATDNHLLAAEAFRHTSLEHKWDLYAQARVSGSSSEATLQDWSDLIADWTLQLEAQEAEGNDNADVVVAKSFALLQEAAAQYSTAPTKARQKELHDIIKAQVKTIDTSKAGSQHIAAHKTMLSATLIQARLYHLIPHPLRKEGPRLTCIKEETFGQAINGELKWRSKEPFINWINDTDGTTSPPHKFSDVIYDRLLAKLSPAHFTMLYKTYGSYSTHLAFRAAIATDDIQLATSLYPLIKRAGIGTQFEAALALASLHEAEEIAEIANQVQRENIESSLPDLETIHKRGEESILPPLRHINEEIANVRDPLTRVLVSATFVNQYWPLYNSGRDSRSWSLRFTDMQKTWHQYVEPNISETEIITVAEQLYTRGMYLAPVFRAATDAPSHIILPLPKDEAKRMSYELAIYRPDLESAIQHVNEFHGYERYTMTDGGYVRITMNVHNDEDAYVRQVLAHTAHTELNKR